MPKLAALALVLVPVAAYADDEAVPVDAVPSVETVEPAQPAEVTVEASASAEVTIGAAPVEVVTPPSEVTPVVAPVPAHRTWCGHSVEWGRTDPWDHAMWFHHRPTLAVGLATGHISGDGGDGTQKALVARIVLNYGFEFEAELAKVQLDEGKLETAGGTLIKTFGHHHILPYLLAGGGAGKLDDTTKVHYGEAGLGLMLRGRHFAISADMRWGVRKLGDDSMDYEARTTMPEPTPIDEAKEHYKRGRITALFYF